MKTELMYLVWVTALTGLIWIPYVVDRVRLGGLISATGYPQQPGPVSGWAKRMKAAHENAIENLVLFAILVLSANAMGISNPATELACAIYFWARLIHLVSYTFAIPWARTLAFVVGFVAQACLVFQLLAYSTPPA